MRTSEFRSLDILSSNESVIKTLRWPTGFSHDSCRGKRRALRPVASELKP